MGGLCVCGCVWIPVVEIKILSLKPIIRLGKKCNQVNGTTHHFQQTFDVARGSFTVWGCFCFVLTGSHKPHPPLLSWFSCLLLSSSHWHKKPLRFFLLFLSFVYPTKKNQPTFREVKGRRRLCLSPFFLLGCLLHCLRWKGRKFHAVTA